MKEERKPILEWLQTLPGDHPKYGNIRERALENCKLSQPNSSTEIRDDLYSALGGAFIFYNDPDGSKYWHEIRDELEAGTLFDYQNEIDNHLPDAGNMVEKSPSLTAVEQPWISVKDRLPEDGVEVPAFFPNGNESGQKRAGGIRSKNKIISSFPNSTAYCFEASHWFDIHSLPEPPKE